MSCCNPLNKGFSQRKTEKRIGVLGIDALLLRGQNKY